jgi:Cd2+/Zn2+-exporting ATPase/Cu+-exporting ATPase
MDQTMTIEIPISGMDCAECTMHVQHAIAALPGVRSVDVFLVSEKAMVQLDPQQVDLGDIRKAVEGAGYAVPEPEGAGAANGKLYPPIMRLLGLSFGWCCLWLWLAMAGVV